VKRLMILAAFSLSPIAAQLSGDIPVKVAAMKAGDKACVFPVTITIEKHAWVSHDAVYRRPGGHCIFVIKRLPDGWRIYTDGVPVLNHGQFPLRDAELRRLKYIKLGVAAKVLDESQRR
jgi:hypothetical protein